MPILSAIAILAASQIAAKPIEVPFRLGDSAIIVDAEVNGRKASLMFDTGFSGSVLLDDGINIGKPKGFMTLRDFVGEFQAPIVAINTLKIGEKVVDAKGMDAVQQPSQGMSFSYNMHCNGIMGFEAIRNSVTQINFEKKCFVFYPDSFDITKNVPDNKKTFLAKLLPKGHGSLEMIVGASNGKKMVLALDTGNGFYATTHKDVLERIGLWEQGKDPSFVKSSFVASGEVASWDIRMKDVNIYGVPVANSVWNIIDLPSSSAEHDGTVGFQFLKNFNITIDFNRRRVWLENFTGKVDNEADGTIGISAFPNPRDNYKAVIVRVSPGSPAEKAGIKPGDQILSIDGNEVLKVGYRQLASMLEGEKGSKVKLVLSRRGELMRLEVERDFLVNVAKG